MWVVLLGAPGCGKGTQSEKLASSYGYVAISTGDLLRANKDRVIEGGRTIGEILVSGALLPDNVTIGVMKDELQKLGSDNVIFDGFPRTLSQAEVLEAMAIECGRKIDKVINFVIDDDVIVKRIIGRFRCVKCGRTYNEFFLNTKVEGICDECGGTEFGRRSDDNEDALRKRLAEYHEKTYPLIDFYSRSGILYSVKAEAPFDEVTESVVKVLNG